MKKIYTIIIGLFIICGSESKAQWTQTSGPYTNSTVLSLATDGINLYAGTQRSGIYLSTDFGVNWTLKSTGLDYFPVHTILINGSTLFAATEDGLYLSSNNGTNWNFILSGSFYSASSIVIKGTTLISANNGGIYRSVNNGSTWTFINSSLVNSTLEVVGNNFIAATTSGVYLSTDDGLTWNLVNGAQTTIQALKTNGTNIFAGTTSGGVFLSTDNGSTWTAKNTGLTNLSIYSFVFNGTDLYAGCGVGVFKSANSGSSWTAVNSGITTTTINALSIMGGEIFSGTTNTGVYLSTNFGTNWTQSNVGMVTSDIRALGFNGTNLFAGSNGSGAYLTGSSGANWNSVNTGLTNQYINVVASSGVNTFVGTNGGVFLSTNNGASWTAMNTGLTNTTVRALVISGSSIFAGTSGGVFLSINNGTSWSAFNTSLTSTNVHSLTLSGTTIFAGTDDLGAFKSPISSSSWTAVNTGLPVSGIYSFYSLVTIGSNVFAAVGSSSGSGVYLTTDNGVTWTNKNCPSSAYGLGVSGTNLFAFAYGIYTSTNNGTSWSNISTDLPTMVHYGFVGSGNTIFIGTVGLGVWKRQLDEVLCSINPPSMTSPSSASICSGTAINIPLTNSGVAATFNWIATDNSQTTGENTTLQSTSTINNVITNTSNLTSANVSYTVTPIGISGGCKGAQQVVTVTVNPLPVMTSNSAYTICSGQSVGLGLTSSVAASYTWIATNNVNTTGESTTLISTPTINDVIINNSLVPQTITYTVTPTSTVGGCAGTPQTVTVTINPTPTMTSVSSATICSGGTVNINLTSSVLSNYTWIAADNLNTTGESTTYQSTKTLSNTVINNASVAQLVTYTIVPTAVVGGCSGSQTFTLTVNPAPNMTSTTTATICSGATASINLISDIASSYVWNAASDNPNTTGESLTPQSTNTLSNTIINNSTIFQIVYYNVVPTSTVGSCVGPAQSVAVTVKPIPTINSAVSASFCSGATVSISLSSNLSSTYVWIATDNTNTTGESITSQSSSIINDVITNNSSVAQNVTYTVTPTATLGGCAGAPQTVTVTTNPIPAMTSASTATICSGGTVNIPLTSNVSSNYLWNAANNVNTTGESTSSQLSNTLNNTISNNSSIAQNVIYTITPTSISASCAGTPQTVTVTVNPAPVLISNTNATICSGAIVNLPLVCNINSTFTWFATDNVNTTGESNTTQTSNTIINTISNTSPFVQSVLYTVTPTSVTGGCVGGNQTISVLVNPLDNANFNYSSAAYCKSGTNPSAIISGLTGGTFSSSTGLVFANVYNGLIDLSASIVSTYTVTYTTGSSCPNSSTFGLTVTSAPSAAFSYTGSPYCSNGTNPLPTFTAGSSAGVFSANPSGLAFKSTVTGEINLTTSIPGTYTITNSIAASGGCASDVQTYIITINPLPVVSFSGLSANYYYNYPAVTLTGSPAGGTFSGAAVTGNIFKPTVAGGGTFTITYSYTDGNGCSNSSSHSTTVLAQPAAPSICEVTVDDAGVYNQIYWDKTQYTKVDSFIVYRETGSGYKRIGAVADSALSLFIDTVRYLYFPNTGDPNAGTYRYKIQIVDSAGNYSPLSPFHNTIYFNKSFGTFTWNHYQIEGQSVPLPSTTLITYDLWRDDNSNGKWNIVNSVTGSQSTQTDVGWNAALDKTASWRVMTNWTIGCTPTRATINTTRSNIKNGSIASGISNNELEQSVSIYPNPANDKVTVEIADSKGHISTIKLVDVIGKVIYETEINDAHSVINVSSFAKGIYTLSIENSGAKIFKKLVIN